MSHRPHRGWLVASLLAFGLTAPAAAHASLVGPIPYLQAADSPYAGTPFVYFHLEDFEDGVLDTPGVSASGGVVLGADVTRDSVDVDDGVIDGFGDTGHALYSSGTRELLIGFSDAALGRLPTHVGLVWTDVGFSDSGLGFGHFEFEAFDRHGNTLGVLSVLLGDGAFTGQTAEDRFFGASSLGGISAIRFAMPDSWDWEVDHLQYGAVPEPTSLVLFGAGLLGLAALRRRR